MMAMTAALKALRRAGLSAAFALILAAAPAAAQLGPPAAELWSRWAVNAAQPTIAPDNRLYARFLARHLVTGRDGINRIAYGRASAADKARLAAYVRGLAATDVDKLTRPQQKAYWINLYNAQTIALVLEAWPVKSIRNVRSYLTLGPWRDKVLTIKGEQLSLDDIEHRILRPIWRDVRVHYAVNCASYSCPNIAPTPYEAATIEAILEQAARDYINHPRGFRLRDGELEASSIYDWYRSDWGDDAAVLRHARRYATPATQRILGNRVKIDSHAYDWSLNAQR